MLVVTKSLCGFMSNQVKYNMESAQYLRKSYYIMIINKYILDIYIYIYLIPWNLDCDPWVSWSFFS